MIGVSVGVIALAVAILVVYLVKTLIEVQKTMRQVNGVTEKVDENIAPILQSSKGLIDETTKTIASVNRKLDKADEVLTSVTTVKEELDKFAKTIGNVRKSVDKLTDNGKMIRVILTYGQKALDFVIGIFQKKDETKIIVTEKVDQKNQNLKRS